MDELPQAAPDYDHRPRPFGKIVAVAVLAIAGYFGWQKARVALFLRNPPQKPYVVLYGTSENQNCEAMRQALKSKNIPFTDMPVGNADIQAMLQPLLVTQSIPPSFDLPLMDVNGQLLANPSIDDVASRYSGAAK